MFKFLRKYNTLILVIGGSLLMIVFLLGNAIPALFQSMGGTSATVATLDDGESISAGTWQEVQNELQFLTTLGVQVPGVGQIREPDHWYLLTREAEAAGFIGAPAGAVLPGFISAEQLDAIASQTRNSRQAVYEKFAKVSGVRRLVASYMNTVKLSDNRLREFAVTLLPSVQTQIVVLEADADKASVMPSEAEITRQFDAYRDIDPGEGEMGFGYKLPNRARLEWLIVEPDAVRDSLVNSDRLSDIELIRHWQRNGGVRGIPPVNENAAEIPQIVKDDLLRELTEDTLDDIAKFIRRQIAEPQRGLATVDGFLQLPADWASKRLPYTELASMIQEKYGIATPSVQSTGSEWKTQSELTAISGLGRAGTLRFSTEPMRLADFFAGARELGDPSPNVQIQSGLTGPILRGIAGTDGAVYAFRFTDIDKSRPARDVNEVRDMIVRDLKRLQHYNTLLSRSSELETAAETDGLLSVALAEGTIIQVPTRVAKCDLNQVNIARSRSELPVIQPTSLPVVGPDEEAVDAIVEYSETLPFGPDVELSEEQRIFIVPVENSLAVLIVRIQQQTPVLESDFTMLVQQQLPQLLIQSEELDVKIEGDAMDGRLVVDAFTREAMIARHNFKLTRDENAPAPANDAPATDETSSAGL
ncbi:MAG: hypothetical protein KC983_10090 [Phycisphaerales bacterium]|nr:hypothetical protein [Phycisphaerales bacterium]